MATTDQPSESSDQTGEAVADTGQLELSDLSDQTGEAVADIGQLKAQYLTKGVVLVTKTSNKYRCVLVCDRGGQYKNSRNLSNEDRKRRGTTRRIGCSFEIVCRLRDGQWHIEKITGEHNHALPNNLAGHAVGRAPKPEEREKILSLSNQGIAPKFIKAVLRTDFANSLITDQDIYNIKKAARNQFLQGRTPMEALIDMVSTNDYFSKVLIENNVVCGVFFMHKNSIELAKLYNTVFLMDCTYKTNKFSMPLLNIVGISSIYTTFNAAFAFLSSEEEPNYTWVLRLFAQVVPLPVVIATDRELALMNSIRTVFPSAKNILCIWHINKNILSNCKKLFATEEMWEQFLMEWNTLVGSKTNDEYEISVKESEEKYRSTSWSYLNNTWIPHKDKFVHYYVNIYPHFGTIATSRVEGNHHLLKSYIRLGNLDLLTVFNRLSIMLENQNVELNAAIEHQKVTKPINVHNCLMDLFYSVSHFALYKIQQQLELLNKSTNGCSGHFSQTWGLPCVHFIRSCIESGIRLPVSSIHSQWMLERNLNSTDEAIMHTPRKKLLQKLSEELYGNNGDERSFGILLGRLSDVIEKPVLKVQESSQVVKKRGRPAGSMNRSSTITREKSQFEYVGRKCSKCKQNGHDKRSCPTPAI